jgi:hypothetical protein
MTHLFFFDISKVLDFGSFPLKAWYVQQQKLISFTFLVLLKIKFCSRIVIVITVVIAIIFIIFSFVAVGTRQKIGVCSILYNSGEYTSKLGAIGRTTESAQRIGYMKTCLPCR